LKARPKALETTHELSHRNALSKTYLGINMSLNRRPNLFIVGAMKAGTTSLAIYLNQHPEIFIALPGGTHEVNFFAPHVTDYGIPWGIGYDNPGLDGYLALFKDAGSATYIGEKSVLYTARPWITDCERRIHDFNPEARIIYVVRDPVERLLSHYRWNVYTLNEDLPLVTAIERREEYLTRSDYAMQWEPYLDAFGADQTRVVVLEEMQADPRKTIAGLLEWLGVSQFPLIKHDVEHNKSPKVVRKVRRGLLPLASLTKHWRWRLWVDQRLSPSVSSFIRRLITTEYIEKNNQLQEARKVLRGMFRSKVDKFEELLGRSLEVWYSRW
jgi:hypothetical protein